MNCKGIQSYRYRLYKGFSLSNLVTTWSEDSSSAGIGCMRIRNMQEGSMKTCCWTVKSVQILNTCWHHPKVENLWCGTLWLDLWWILISWISTLKDLWLAAIGIPNTTSLRWVDSLRNVQFSSMEMCSLTLKWE